MTEQAKVPPITNEKKLAAAPKAADKTEKEPKEKIEPTELTEDQAMAQCRSRLDRVKDPKARSRIARYLTERAADCVADAEAAKK
jgi:hypothetical protein